MRGGSLLRRGRAFAESLHVDTFQVWRADPDGAVDPLTGDPVFVSVYEGSGKVQDHSQYEMNPVAGEHQLTTQRYLVHFAMDAFEPRIYDVVEVLSSAHDATLPGRRFRIAAPFGKSFLTARRMYAEEVLG